MNLQYFLIALLHLKHITEIEHLVHLCLLPTEALNAI